MRGGEKTEEKGGETFLISRGGGGERKTNKKFFFLFLDSIVIHRHCCACCAVAKLSFFPAAKPANWSNFPKKSSEDSREGNRNGGKKTPDLKRAPEGKVLHFKRPSASSHSSQSQTRKGSFH